MTDHLVTSQQARAITAEVEAAIAEVFKRHGLDPKVSATKYGPTYKVTIEGARIVLNDAGVNTASPEAQAYDRYASVYGLKPGLVGKSITVQGKQVTFIGLMPKRTKFPYAFTTGGKVVLYSDAIVERLNATVA